MTLEFVEQLNDEFYTQQMDILIELIKNTMTINDHLTYMYFLSTTNQIYLEPRDLPYYLTILDTFFITIAKFFKYYDLFYSNKKYIKR